MKHLEILIQKLDNKKTKLILSILFLLSIIFSMI